MACDFHLLPHPGIQTLHPYVPGKSIEELAQERGLTDIIKLASNENPLGCSPLVLDLLSKTAGSVIATYPSPAIHPLRKKLSAFLNINPEMLMLSNGSDLLFSILLKTFALHQNKHIVTHEYAFSSYKIQAQTLGIPVRISADEDNWQVNINHILAEVDEHTALIFIANPNNPTGFFLALDEIEHLLKSIPSTTILVLDEAYYEFAYPAGDPAGMAFLAKYPNLVITRTFSKAYGLAGLRIGYAIAHEHIIQLLLRVQLPFAVNQLAMLAAERALEDQSFVQDTLKLNERGKSQMFAGLEALNVPFVPSHCNFVTIDCQKQALPIYEGLLGHGIIVRPLKPYDLPNHLRVSIGNEEQNNRFLRALPLCLND